MGSLASFLVTALWLSPALGRGVLLYRDFVQVPHPVLGPAALGGDGRAPRAVPLDAVTALLHPLVPSGVQQQLLLLASLALAGCGTAFLLRRHGSAAALTGAVLATWNPYTAERLLLGQPPTLLGWAMTSWLVAATRLPGPSWRRLLAVALAAAPAALTPFGGLLAAATVLVTRLAIQPVTPPQATPETPPRARHRRREDLALAALAVAWCLPWAIPAVLGAHDAGQRTGAEAFAVRHEGLLSVSDVLDVVGGGGVWAPAAQLTSRLGGIALLPSLALLVLAVAAVVLPSRRSGDLPTDRPSDLPTDRPSEEQDGLSPRTRRVVLAALLLPPVVALLLATPLGLAGWARAQDVPGVGLFRDTHRLLGISTLATALLVGVGVGDLARRIAPAQRRVRPTAAALAVVACSLTILAAPEAPARTRAVYRPVVFPAAWQEAVDTVGDRTTLVLPWQPFRRESWAGTQPFLDPLPLALPGRTLTATALTVRRDGRPLRVGTDDDTAVRAWERGDLEALRRAGIEAVVAWAETPGTPPTPAAAGSPVIGDGPLRVWLLRR